MALCKSTPGFVHSTETFGLVDGPGVRFVVFTQGCPMRCRYCHNPDTWAVNAGQTMEPDALLEKALRYRTYWKDTGGITVSGGEPLMQVDFVYSLLKAAKEEGVHTAIDTSGILFTRNEPFFSKLNELLSVTDLVLLDLKHIDDDAHKDLTRHGNDRVLEFARYLSEIGKPVWIRHVLVPGVNDDDESLMKLDAFISTLSNVKRVEILPYHTLGVHKWENLGVPYTLEGVNPPDAELIAHANQLLHTERYDGYLK